MRFEWTRMGTDEGRRRRLRNRDWTLIWNGYALNRRQLLFQGEDRAEQVARFLDAFQYIGGFKGERLGVLVAQGGFDLRPRQRRGNGWPFFGP